MSDELEETDDADAEDGKFILDEYDRRIVKAAECLLLKIMRAPFARPCELVSVAKALHVLTRLPLVTEGVSLLVGLAGPTRRFGDHKISHWWDVQIESEGIQIASGGHFYRPSSGGDSFTCLQWNAQPGMEAACLDLTGQNQIVDDAERFEPEVVALDLTQPGYSLRITDDDNGLLEGEADEEPTDNDRQDEGNFLTCLSDAERRLARQCDGIDGRRRGVRNPDPPATCDFCHKDFRDCRFFVDGRLRGSAMWANMCGPCFFQRGEGIRWGDGQLYAKQPDGEWLLVGGFDPSEEATGDESGDET